MSNMRLVHLIDTESTGSNMNPYQPTVQTGQQPSVRANSVSSFDAATRVVGILLALVTGYFLVRILYGAAVGVFSIMLAILVNLP